MIENDVENESRIVRQHAPNVVVWKYAVVAAISIALITSYLAFQYWTKWKRTENNLETAKTQIHQVEQDYNQINERLKQVERDLQIINNPDFTRVILEGTANAPEAMVYIYWNPTTQEVYLSIQNLPPLSQENQYQLWAIIDGEPIDAGVFDSQAERGLLQMKAIGVGPSVFAVTIENTGGSQAPSLENMQVAGNITKG